MRWTFFSMICAFNILSAEDRTTVDRGLSDYFGISLHDVARGIANADLIVKGVIQIDSNGENVADGSRFVAGNIIVEQLLLGSAKETPRSIFFRRDVSMVALVRGESSIIAPFYLWNTSINGVQVIAFAKKQGDQWSLLKVIPTTTKDAISLIEALRALQEAHLNRDDQHSIQSLPNFVDSPLAEMVKSRLLEEMRRNPKG